MVDSAESHVEILEKLNFQNIAISLKASNLDLCIQSYEEASKRFARRSAPDFPAPSRKKRESNSCQRSLKPAVMM